MAVALEDRFVRGQGREGVREVYGPGSAPGSATEPEATPRLEAVSGGVPLEDKFVRGPRRSGLHAAWEVPYSLGSGIVSWMAGAGTNIWSQLHDTLLNQAYGPAEAFMAPTLPKDYTELPRDVMTPQEIADRGKMWADAMSFLAYEPESGTGRAVAGPIGKIFHGLTFPAGWVGKQAGKIDPRLQAVVTFGGELLTFKGLHYGGGKLYRKIRKVKDSIDSGDPNVTKEAVSDVVDELKALGISPEEIAKARTPAERQVLINKAGLDLPERAGGKPGFRTPEARQAEIGKQLDLERVETFKDLDEFRGRYDVKGPLPETPITLDRPIPEPTGPIGTPLSRQGFVNRAMLGEPFQRQEHIDSIYNALRGLRKQRKELEKTLREGEDAKRPRGEVEKAREPLGEGRKVEETKGREPERGEGQVPVRDTAEDRVGTEPSERLEVTEPIGVEAKLLELTEEAESKGHNFSVHDYGDELHISYIRDKNAHTGKHSPSLARVVDKLFILAAKTNKGISSLPINPWVEEVLNKMGAERLYSRYTISPERLRQYAESGKTFRRRMTTLKLEETGKARARAKKAAKKGITFDQPVGRDYRVFRSSISDDIVAVRAANDQWYIRAKTPDGRFVQSGPFESRWEAAERFNEAARGRFVGDIREAPPKAEPMKGLEAPRKELPAPEAKPKAKPKPKKEPTRAWTAEEAEQRIREIRKAVEKPPAEQAKPKGVPEFKEEDFRVDLKGRGAIRTNFDYDLYGTKKLGSVEEARAYLETPRVKKARSKLQEDRGIDLEIIKVGDNYRLAEPLRMSAVEEANIDAAIKKYAEERGRMPGAADKLDFREIGRELEKFNKDIEKWVSGDESVNITPIVERITQIRNTVGHLIGSTEARAVADLVDLFSQRIAERLREKIAETDPGMKVEKNPREGREAKSVVLDESGEPFKDMFDALKYMEDKKLKGTVTDHPEGGFLIELRKRVPYKWTGARKASRRRFIKTVLKDLRGLLGDQRGFIEGVSPERLETIRKVAREAARAGRGVKEHLKNLGFSEKDSALFEKAAKELSTKYGMGKPSVGTENYETGEVVSDKKKKVKIREGERESLKEGDDIKPSRLREFVNTIHVIRESGVGVLRDLHRTYWSNEREFKEVMRGLREEVKKLRRKVTHKSAERLSKYAISQQEFGMERLKAHGYREKSIPKWENLTAKEKEVYNLVRDRLEETFTRIQEMREAIGSSKLKYTPNYFTFAYAIRFLETIGLRKSTRDRTLLRKPNPILDDADVITKQYVEYSKTAFPYARVRNKLGFDKALNLDFFDVYANYMRSAERHLIMSPLVAKIKALRGKLKDGTKDGKPNYFRLRDKKPQLDAWLARWGNTIAGEDIGNYFAQLDRSAIGRAVRVMNKNLAVSILGANVRSALIQVSALRNTSAEIGTMKTAQGIYDVFSVRKFKEAHKLSDVLPLRRSESIFYDLWQEIQTRKVGKAISGVRQVSMLPLQALDMVTATATWRGAYRLAKKKGWDKKNAAHFADEAVVKTQASSLPGDLAPIQRTAIGKALTMFQTFTIADWNFLIKDVLGMRNKSVSNYQAFRKASHYLFATVLWNMFFEDVLQVQSPFPTLYRAAKEAREEGKEGFEVIMEVVKEATEPVPMIGSTRYGKTFLGPAVQYAQDFGYSVSDIFGKKHGKKLWEETGKGLGIPGMGQYIKYRKAKRRGESTYGAWVGKYTPKRKSRGGFSGFSGFKGFEGFK